MSSSLTSEQESVILADDHHVTVQAYAGTGKTYTLTQLANHYRNKRILYIAYNSSIAKEARRKFPRNVQCSTSHALAYGQYGSPLADKLKGELNGRAVSQAIGNNFSDADAQKVLNMINAFLYSADRDIRESIAAQSVIRHLPVTETVQLTHYAAKIWARMIDPADAFPSSHDAYLKLFQIEGPKFDHDIIMLDEAQDTNPCVMAILMNQPGRKILVGDEHQSIYRFRGGENALDKLPNARRMYLTQSFRFGPECAQLANKILALKGKEIPKIFGAATKRTEIISPFSPRANIKFLTDMQYKPAILHRTVSQCVISALDMLSQGRKVHWIGGIDRYNFTEILDVFYLSKNQKQKINNPHFQMLYRSYKDYTNVAEDTGDHGMARIIDFITRYKDKTDGVFKLIRACHYPAREADIFLSTAHKSKGLEWDGVLLAGDFINVVNNDRCQFDPAVYRDEINLNYVAATRGMKCLINCKNIHEAVFGPLPK